MIYLYFCILPNSEVLCTTVCIQLYGHTNIMCSKTRHFSTIRHSFNSKSYQLNDLREQSVECVYVSMFNFCIHTHTLSNCIMSFLSLAILYKGTPQYTEICSHLRVYVYCIYQQYITYHNQLQSRMYL